MFEKLEIVRMAQAMASHAGRRQAVISTNIANADTPGYKARDIADFAETYQEPRHMRSTRAGHIDALPPGQAEPQLRFVKGAESPDGNSVSLEAEMVRAVETKQSHDMALAIYRTASDVIRTSLGRRA